MTPTESLVYTLKKVSGDRLEAEELHYFLSACLQTAESIDIAEKARDAEMSALQSGNAELLDKMELLQGKMGQLQGKMEQLQADKCQLEHEEKRLQTENALLQSRNSQLQSELDCAHQQSHNVLQQSLQNTQLALTTRVIGVSTRRKRPGTPLGWESAKRLMLEPDSLNATPDHALPQEQQGGSGEAVAVPEEHHRAPEEPSTSNGPEDQSDGPDAAQVLPQSQNGQRELHTVQLALAKDRSQLEALRRGLQECEEKLDQKRIELGDRERRLQEARRQFCTERHQAEEMDNLRDLLVDQAVECQSTKAELVEIRGMLSGLGTQLETAKASRSADVDTMRQSLAGISTTLNQVRSGQASAANAEQMSDAIAQIGNANESLVKIEAGQADAAKADRLHTLLEAIGNASTKLDKVEAGQADAAKAGRLDNLLGAITSASTKLDQVKADQAASVESAEQLRDAVAHVDDRVVCIDAATEAYSASAQNAAITLSGIQSTANGAVSAVNELRSVFEEHVRAQSTGMADLKTEASKYADTYAATNREVVEVRGSVIQSLQGVDASLQGFTTSTDSLRTAQDKA